MAGSKHVLLRIFGILRLIKLLKTLRGGAAAFVNQVISPLLSQPYVQDAVRLTIVGSAIGLVHSLIVKAYMRLSDACHITVTFGATELPYWWLDHYLHLENMADYSRIVSVYAFPYFERGDFNPATAKPWYRPTSSIPFTMWWKGRRLRVIRFHGDSIKIRLLAWDRKPIDELIAVAQRKYYEKDALNTIVYIHDSNGNWSRTTPRTSRPLSSIILEPDLLDMLVKDAKRYLSGQQWYIERGIPWRRGWLLHGLPGSGKTSTVYALAGELGLPIYCLNLANKGISDSNILDVIAWTASRCIILFEDIDAMQSSRKGGGALEGSINKSAVNTPAIAQTPATEDEPSATAAAATKKTEVTLSGLLNAIDGISAPEGRLVICTTNHKEKLDPALTRAGRLDVWVEFTHATKWQAAELFKVFYPSAKWEKLSPSIAELSKEFSDAVPENSLSVADIQGYLMVNHLDPIMAARSVGVWAQKYVETRREPTPVPAFEFSKMPPVKGVKGLLGPLTPKLTNGI